MLVAHKRFKGVGHWLKAGRSASVVGKPCKRKTLTPFSVTSTHWSACWAFAAPVLEKIARGVMNNNETALAHRITLYRLMNNYETLNYTHCSAWKHHILSHWLNDFNPERLNFKTV